MGRTSASTLKLADQAVEPGASIQEIDRIAHRYIENEGAKPSSLGYGGPLASAYISASNVVIYGIPNKDLILGHGDIVSIDTGTLYEDFTGDSAYTLVCGDVSPEAQCLMDTIRESPYEGIRVAEAGNRVDDVGHVA